jgi:hypothetical protein
MRLVVKMRGAPLLAFAALAACTPQVTREAPRGWRA